MEQNPYESPTIEVGEHGHWQTLVLRIVALGCWSLSLLFVAAFLTIANRPEIREQYAENPVLFSILVVAVFGLPAIGLAILGIASWSRVRWLGLIGIACLVPLVALTLFALLRSA